MATWQFDTAAIEGLVHHPKVQDEADARADRGVAAAIQRCPFDEGRKDPGVHLVETIRKERVGAGRRVSYGGPEAAYAPHVEWGTLPHEIRARPGGWLRWEDRVTGEVRFAKRVWHPGTPAFHVMGGAGVDAARA